MPQNQRYTQSVTQAKPKTQPETQTLIFGSYSEPRGSTVRKNFYSHPNMIAEPQTRTNDSPSRALTIKFKGNIYTFDYNAPELTEVQCLSTKETIEERKAQILMGLRGYKLIKRKKHKEGISFHVKTSQGKELLIFCWPTQGTVGVQIINQVKKIMKNEKTEKGLLVTSGRFTQAAKTNARKRGIELIPRLFPSFNIFEHVFVPKHEIVGAEEREKLLSDYRVQPYQLPRLKASDPACRAIDAKPGDIVRVIRDSQTAGKYTSYRYVVEG